MPRSLPIVRWFIPLLAGIVVLAAAGVVTDLHKRSVAISGADSELMSIRHAVTVSDGVAWATVAQGQPNFTFAQELAQARAAVTANLAPLRSDLTEAAQVQRLTLLNGILWTDVLDTERLIAGHHDMAANTEVLTGVDGIVGLMDATIASIQHVYSARIASANENLYVGSLLALAATGSLVALLALLYAAGRRRTLAAEQAAARRSEQRFRALVHRASEVVFVVGRDARITYVTDASASVLGYQPEELIGHPMDVFLPEAERDRAHAVFDRIQRAGQVDPREWSFVRPDGTETVLEARSEDRLDDPNINGVVVTIRDVSSRRQMEMQLRHQALHDGLTGLANRTLFEDRVRQALQRSRRTGHLTGIVYIDLDAFKAVNDSLGHAAGDELLRVVAGRIDSCLRATDTSARLGGDEFACLLEDLDDPEQSAQIARRIVSVLAAPVSIGDRTVNPQASLGLAFSDKPVDPEQLVRHADLAMYSAKQAGGGGVATFHDELLTAADARLRLREDLPGAPARDEMALAYQPIVATATEQIVGLEALLRWSHPEHGAIGPDRFIPLAEETGAIIGLGRWVMDRAVADLRRLSAAHPHLTLNVNVSPRELGEPDYVDVVTATLERHSVAPHRLTIEVTESEALDEGDALPRLQQLSALGIRIAIDDFGTGLSSLARLQRLPVDQVKMDRSFLATADESRQDEILLRSILELGQALGLQMVAEGVEREGQAQVLRASDCPLAQGYLFARPQPLDAVTELLRARSAEAAQEAVVSRR